MQKNNNTLLRWLITLTVCTLLLIAVQARGADEWTRKDIQLEIACVVVNVLDGVTTERILDENNRAFEAGPARLLFGDRPSQAELAGGGRGVQRVTCTGYALHAEAISAVLAVVLGKREVVSDWE